VTVSRSSSIFFAERLEIDRHAKRRPDFILPPVTPADRAAFVVEHVHVRPQQRLHFARFRHQCFFVPEKRKDRAFYRRHSRMESHHDPRFHFSFFVRALSSS
jgi:hypothetical protein